MPPTLTNTGALVERHWRAHKGTICAGVSWDAMPLQELLEIADCIGGVGLSVAFRVMAEDGAGSQGLVLVWFVVCLARARTSRGGGHTRRCTHTLLAICFAHNYCTSTRRRLARPDPLEARGAARHAGRGQGPDRPPLGPAVRVDGDPERRGAAGELEGACVCMQMHTRGERLRARISGCAHFRHVPRSLSLTVDRRLQLAGRSLQSQRAEGDAAKHHLRLRWRD